MLDRVKQLPIELPPILNREEAQLVNLISCNPYYVATYLSLSRNPIFAYYSKEGIASMLRRINIKTSSQSINAELRPGKTALSRGIGVVFPDKGKNDLNQRLEQNLKEEILALSFANKKLQWHTINDHAFAFPIFDTKGYPKIHPVIIQNSSPSVLLLTQGNRDILQNFVSNHGYIDETLVPIIKTKLDDSVMEINRIFKKSSESNPKLFINIYPGYTLENSYEPRIGFIKSSLKYQIDQYPNRYKSLIYKHKIPIADNTRTLELLVGNTQDLFNFFGRSTLPFQDAKRAQYLLIMATKLYPYKETHTILEITDTDIDLIKMFINNHSLSLDLSHLDKHTRGNIRKRFENFIKRIKKSGYKLQSQTGIKVDKTLIFPGTTTV